MDNVVVSAEHYEELIKKAAMFDLICAIHGGQHNFMVLDMLEYMKGELDDGPSDCTES